jgi:RimJ/RimL family protein N-acetyltransferase
MNLQPRHLHNEQVVLIPLSSADFERLYAVACDPLIWEQHPNKNRYQEKVFATYFEGAIASGGAFLVCDGLTGQPIGSTRFYDFDAAASEVKIGYTFFARSHWGTTCNRATKTLMLNYAFQHVDKVIFHIGAFNTRSQIAISRLGAVKVGEEPIEYYGETPQLNFVYEISKQAWQQRPPKS